MSIQQLKSVSPRQLLSVALVLAAVAALTWLLRDTVRDLVVIPLTYLFWIADLFIRSVPQSIQLILLVVFSALVSLRAIVAGRVPAERAAPMSRRSAEFSRLGMWSRQLHNIDDSAYSAERMAHELRTMITSTLGAEWHCDRDEIVTRARAGELDLPEEVRDLLVGHPRWLNIQPGNSLSRSWRNVRARLYPNEPRPKSIEMARKLNVVIAYVEALGGISKELT